MILPKEGFARLWAENPFSVPPYRTDGEESMRAVAQRVLRAWVDIEGRRHAHIGPGLHVYLGVDKTDADRDAAYLADKVAHLRVFPDEKGLMNLSVLQAQGEVLVVSAFTVSADARKGRRPTFDTAASGAQAERLYEVFCRNLDAIGLTVRTGAFGADMEVGTINAGPVCILLDSHKTF